jgi:hypothetical protein
MTLVRYFVLLVLAWKATAFIRLKLRCILLAGDARNHSLGPRDVLNGNVPLTAIALVVSPRRSCAQYGQSNKRSFAASYSNLGVAVVSPFAHCSSNVQYATMAAISHVIDNFTWINLWRTYRHLKRSKNIAVRVMWKRYLISNSIRRVGR